MVMWQQAGPWGSEEAPLAEASYGSATIGFVSAFTQDWSYHVALAPGAGGLAEIEGRMPCCSEEAAVAGLAGAGAAPGKAPCSATGRAPGWPPYCCLPSPAPADVPLVACLLAVYTDLVDWNAGGAITGMH